jgi:hypothetical protein
MPNNSTLQPDQTLPTPLAQAPRLHLPLHNLLPKPPVSPIPSGAEREAQTSLALPLPAFPRHRGLVRTADKSMSAPRAAALLRAQIYFFAVLLAFCFTCSAATRASELTQPTAEAFQRYVQRTEARMQSELADPEHFLYFDALSKEAKNSMLTRLHSGQVVIEQMKTYDNGKEIKVPGGLVHHWMAIGFIPGISRDQMINLAQDYPRHPEVYAPDVQRAQVLEHFDQHFLVSYRFYRHAIVTTVYNTEFNVDYQLPDSSRGYCSARAVRIAEVQNPGKPDEKELSVGNDHGYMWRLNLYTRYLEKDNGVYVQIEFVALSRSAPGIVGWVANPYIRSIPTAYLTNYVRTTQRTLSSQERFSGN